MYAHSAHHRNPYAKGGGILARRSDSSVGGKLLALLRASVILSAIDRFTQCIYSALQSGFFGTLFTAYPAAHASAPGGRLARAAASVRRFSASTVEESTAVHLFQRLIRFFLRCRTRVYGTFFLTFGIYAAAAYLLGILGEDGRAPTLTLAAALVLAGISLPLLTSNVSLASALLESRLAGPILAFLGIRREALRVRGEAGRSNLALIAGMAAGMCAFVIPPIWLIAGGIGIFLAYRVFVTPELGVVLLFFGMPFLPTMILAALVIFTAFCLAVKLILGRRRLSLEPVDIAALAFAVSLGCGGVFSFSAGSLKPALLFICLLCAYFLTVTLIRTAEWLAKCLWSAISAAVLVALYGIFQYFSGSLASAGAWLDSEMFEDIAGRAVSTLENPNMLAEYLIMLLPLAAAQMLVRGSLPRRASALLSCAAMGACVILTWSRGAWLGLIFAALVFVLIWSRRSIYLLVAGVASIPFLPLILPDSIIHRFTSIGNLADSSTSYRVNIWRGTVRMLEDYWMTGIGIGEAAWETVYPRYSLAAIETAPHAHNLYLQTWVQTGIVGLLLLIAFIILLLQSNFACYRALSHMHRSLPDAVISARLKPERAADMPGGIRRTASRGGEGEKLITSMRLEAAAPLCGILATLVQGLTEYTWYNYRVYLMFWLIAGLSAAYVRCIRAETDRLMGCAEAEADPAPTEAEAELTLTARAESSKKGNSRHA